MGFGRVGILTPRFPEQPFQYIYKFMILLFSFSFC